MTPYEQAFNLYQRHDDKSLIHDILTYSREGYVHITPRYIILAAHWSQQHCWYIHLAVGRGAMAEFFRLAPFELPWVAFARPGKGRHDIRYYPTYKLKRLCTLYTNMLNRSLDSGTISGVELPSHPPL